MSNILVTGGLGFIGSSFISKIINKEKFVVNVDSETYASVDKSFLNFELHQNYKHYNLYYIILEIEALSHFYYQIKQILYVWVIFLIKRIL